MDKELCFENTSLDGEVHFLRKPDSYVSKILCFPMSACDDLRDRLGVLLEDGFIYLLESGVKIHGLRILGRGYTAVVVVAYNSTHGLGSLKLLRSDSRRSSLVKEAEIMKLVETTGLSPKVYLYKDFYVFYELLPPHICKSITFILDELIINNRVDYLKRLLYNMLKSLHQLDQLGVDHSEINRPDGHIFYCSGSIKIIDWESARVSRKPSNLTSFISYLIYRYKYASRIREVLKIDTSIVLNLLRSYKTYYSIELFDEIARSMSLQP
ncbi:MAG: serine/threonine protein kinase [Desulfurococcaceae archaeon]